MKKTLITTLLCLGFAATAQAVVVIQDGSTTDYTVTSDNLQVNSRWGTTTITGTVTDPGCIEIVAKDGGATYVNVYFYGDDNRLVQIGYSGDASSISNAAITILGDYEVRNTSFADSTLTVKSGATLTAGASDTQILTLGALTVEAGGKVSSTGGAPVKYNGGINLSLALKEGLTTYDAGSKTLTTTALYGTMQSGSSLTLDFSSIAALSSYAAGESFTLELTNLTQASGFSATGNFTATGWNVTYNTASDKTSLTLTKAAAVPEPTTATLSLLALAGLAARRRRK